MLASRSARRCLAATAAGAVLGLSGCVSLPPPADPAPGVVRAFDRVDLSGEARDLEWHLPAGEPRAWVLVQHGFARRCAHLRGTASALAARGVATLCVNVDSGTGLAQGAPALAQALADWWRSPAARSPDGRAAPWRVVLTGHSAGGLFAAQVGARLASAEPARVSGVILFDPVGAVALREALQVLARHPLAATLAPPGRCNAQQLARPALREAGVAIVQAAQATHLDAEGEDSDSVAVRACGEGPPRVAAVKALRAWAADTLETMLR